MENKLKNLFLLFTAIILITACGNNNIDVGGEITAPVSVEDVKLKSIEEFIDAAGAVYSEKEATLRSEISGYYKLLVNPKTGRQFKLGDKVSAGVELIKLEDPEYENEIRIDLKKLQLEQSKSEYEKQKSLFDKGGVTQKELKTAELDYLNQQYTYENAKLQLDKMIIKAPFEGVIAELPNFTPGVKISQNLTLVKLMNYRHLYLELNLPEKEMPSVHINQIARILNYTMPDDTLYGKITQKSPVVESGSRTFKVVVSVDNPDWLLRPGMFVKAEIIAARKDSAIVIPKNLILTRRRGKTVYVVIKGASQERVIQTGLENPDEIEVTSGLKVNERLVVKGYETLRNRQKVKIIK